jgi:hypothetical protein
MVVSVRLMSDWRSSAGFTCKATCSSFLTCRVWVALTSAGCRREAFHAVATGQPGLLKGIEMDEHNLTKKQLPAIIIAGKLLWIANTLADSENVEWTIDTENNMFVEKSGAKVAINTSYAVKHQNIATKALRGCYDECVEPCRAATPWRWTKRRGG